LAPSQPFKVAIQRQVAPAYYPNNVVDLVPTKPGRGRKLGSKNKPKGPASAEANKEPQRPKKRGPKPKPPEGRAQRPAESPHRIPTKDPPVAGIAEQLSDEERCILERGRKRLDDVYKPGMRSRQGDSTMKKYWEELCHWKANHRLLFCCHLSYSQFPPHFLFFLITCLFAYIFRLFAKVAFMNGLSMRIAYAKKVSTNLILREWQAKVTTRR
jgi:hypothetical protein